MECPLFAKIAKGNCCIENSNLQFPNQSATYAPVFRPSKLLQKCQHNSIWPTKTSLQYHENFKSVQMYVKQVCNLSILVFEFHTVPGVCIPHHLRMLHTFAHHIFHALRPFSCIQCSWFWSTSQLCLLPMTLLLLIQISANLQLSCVEVEPSHLESPCFYNFYQGVQYLHKDGSPCICKRLVDTKLCHKGF